MLVVLLELVVVDKIEVDKSLMQNIKELQKDKEEKHLQTFKNLEIKILRYNNLFLDNSE